MQPAADGILGQALAALLGHELPQQRHRPVHGLIAPGAGRLPQRLPEQGLQVSRPGPGPAAARLVQQGPGVVGGPAGVQPVVHAAAADAEDLRHLGGGAAGVDFEDGQGPAVDRGVARREQLLVQPLSLPGSQV
jgi:hypothetical protein